VSSRSNTIKQLLAEVCAIDPASIVGDRPLLEYGLDSARAIDLLVALEGEFDIRIPDADASAMRTLDDVVAYVEKRAKPGAP
jgi:acyl carrier protein